MQEEKSILVKNHINSYKLIVRDKLENKIRFLCSRFYNTEWSGVLFWTISGSFESKDIIVYAEDFLLMDIGGATTTAFEMSPKVISYMTENNLMNTYVGLMHSHHNMSTFFSGIDQDTLLSEGQNSNHFVSLIVNNAGVYSAAITRLVTASRKVQNNIVYKTFKDEAISSIDDYDEIINYVEWFPLIVKQETANNYESIEQDIKEIEQQKKQKKINKYIIPEENDLLLDDDIDEFYNFYNTKNIRNGF